MRCRFWLVDLNESLWEGRPCVRLWGIDDRNQRVIIVATQIAPYFYFLPSDDIEAALKYLDADKNRFPNITHVSTENRKLLGKERTVLRIECSQPKSASDYAKLLPKLRGGTSFDDLRLSTHYVTDLNLTTSGWNECEVEPASIEDVAADCKYIATSPPRGICSNESPRLRLLAFAILAIGQRGTAIPQRDPIRLLAIATDSDASVFTATNGDDSQLLTSFNRAIGDVDPDVIVGYDTNKWQWEYLTQRTNLNKKKLSPGRDGSELHTSVFGHLSIAGRANVDLADLAGGIPQVKVKDLKNLATYFKLPTADKLCARDDWETHTLWTTPSGQRQLIEDTKVTAQVLFELARETINYPLQLSAITGLPLDQVMATPVGFRVDSYFLKIAHQVSELIPKKNELPYLTYKGALVQEPKTGVYENVAVLDFASMYPSLMKKNNLSPDTVVGPEEEVSPESVFLIPEFGYRFRKKPDGFYRIALSSLIENRARVQSELAHSTGEPASRVFRERERAIKVMTNACYGYAGWAGARWYVREVAESAAALGRQLITETIAKATSLGLEVIYSDTDSIFVSNDKHRVRELIDWVKTRDPDSKDSGLEIRVEAEYERVLFTEAMKRYAGLRPDGTLDIVGLEVIRGDWSDIARSVQESVLNAILKHDSTSLAIADVRETVQRLRNHAVPIKSCIIWKTLTKPIEKYRTNAPHVEAAKKLAKEGWHVTVGDKVAYVIVKGRGALFQRAIPYHAAKLEDLDVDYYVQSQVKPAAMRILEGFGVTEAQLGV